MLYVEKRDKRELLYNTACFILFHCGELFFKENLNDDVRLELVKDVKRRDSLMFKPHLD